MLSLRVCLELMLVSGAEALGLLSLFSALSEKVIRSLFTTLLRRFIYKIISRSALNYSDFVVNAITELKVGSFVECPFPPVVNPPVSFSSIQWEEKAYLRC